MLDNGERISMNNEEAIEYFNIVIEKSNSYEMYLCYMMLDKGNGIPMNRHLRQGKFHQIHARA